jgi:hypothetical protein
MRLLAKISHTKALHLKVGVLKTKSVNALAASPLAAATGFFPLRIAIKPRCFGRNDKRLGAVRKCEVGKASAKANMTSIGIVGRGGQPELVFAASDRRKMLSTRNGYP